ncbi:unnamed protein product, partial [Protopolystoma xenopodis]
CQSSTQDRQPITPSLDSSIPLEPGSSDSSLSGSGSGAGLVPGKWVHIKKPLNAFMLFMKEMRARVVAECTLKESAAINQILGRRWHALSRDEQTRFYDMARLEKEAHQRLYPNWSARDNYASHSKKKKRQQQQQHQQRHHHQHISMLLHSPAECSSSEAYRLGSNKQSIRECLEAGDSMCPGEEKVIAKADIEKATGSTWEYVEARGSLRPAKIGGKDHEFGCLPGEPPGNGGGNREGRNCRAGQPTGGSDLSTSRPFRGHKTLRMADTSFSRRPQAFPSGPTARHPDSLALLVNSALSPTMNTERLACSSPSRRGADVSDYGFVGRRSPLGGETAGQQGCCNHVGCSRNVCGEYPPLATSTPFLEGSATSSAFSAFSSCSCSFKAPDAGPTNGFTSLDSEAGVDFACVKRGGDEDALCDGEGDFHISTDQTADGCRTSSDKKMRFHSALNELAAAAAAASSHAMLSAAAAAAVGSGYVRERERGTNYQEHNCPGRHFHVCMKGVDSSEVCSSEFFVYK